MELKVGNSYLINGNGTNMLVSTVGKVLTCVLIGYTENGRCLVKFNNKEYGWEAITGNVNKYSEEFGINLDIGTEGLWFVNPKDLYRKKIHKSKLAERLYKNQIEDQDDDFYYLKITE